MIEVDLSIEPVWGDSRYWQGISERGLAEALRVADLDTLNANNSNINVSIRFADNAEVQTLNRDYRQKDMPTNVLSFPMLDGDEIDSLRHPCEGGGPTPDGENSLGPVLDSRLRGNDEMCNEILLGDIILAYETCAAETTEKGIPLRQHVTHLIIHGTLHLLGYDHIDDSEAEIMEALEVKALASLGLANPYSD
jgi:probable rRNA maturation factor